MKRPATVAGCFFARPELRDPPGSRLLLVSYHFPPGQAIGALRWQKLALHAAERGWNLDVITLDPSSSSAPDPMRLHELPQGIRLFGVVDKPHPSQRLDDAAARLRLRLHPRRSANPPAESTAPPRRRSSLSHRELRFEPLSGRSWLRAYQSWANLAAERAWARRAVGLGRRLVAADSHSAVVSSGPPHMAHEAARRLARASHLPLVLDLRDPWSAIERLPESMASPVWIRLARFYEARAVHEAALVVMNTEPARQTMQTRYPEQAQRIIAVMNGCDEEELPTAERSRRFVIAYAGTLYLDRDPSNLFRAAARVVSALELAPADFAIELMGAVGSFDGRSIERLAGELGLEGYVRLHPRGTRGAAMEFLARATMLVNLPQDSHLAIPSKVFEYMRYDAWLLALAQRDSATELLLRDTEADVVAPDDVDGLAAVLQRRYREHADGRRARSIAAGDRFSRRTQAERLFSAVEQITGPPRSIPSPSES